MSDESDWSDRSDERVSVERGVGDYFAISARKLRRVEPSSIDGV